MLKGKTIARRIKDKLFSFVAYNVSRYVNQDVRKEKKNEPQFILGDPERYKRYREEWEKANSDVRKEKKNEDKGLYVGALRKFAEHSVKVLVWTNMETGKIEITVMPI